MHHRIRRLKLLMKFLPTLCNLVRKRRCFKYRRSVTDFLIGFLFFCTVTAVYSVWMIYYVCPKYGTQNPVYYLSICAGTGAVSVMALKAFGIAVKLTFAGANQF